MMAVPSMTPVLSGLLVARETEPKTSASVIRSAPSRAVLTEKAIIALAPPVEVLSDGGERRGLARDVDGAMRVAREFGGSGRFIRRGRVIGYWGAVPGEQR